MLRVVVAYNRQAFEWLRFRRQGEEAVRARIRVTLGQTVYGMVVAILTGVGTGLVIAVGAHRVLRNQLTLGELLVIMSYVAAIYQPLETISTTSGRFQEYLIGLRNAKHLLDEKPDVVDLPDAIDLPVCRRVLRFEKVSFDYPKRSGTVREVSFVAEPGESVAIVGPTGAGKTTLMNLLVRYFDPKDGRITLDGIDIRTITQLSLREHLALVPQEPLLFPKTIMENIRYGRLDASDDDVLEAAKAANAHDFIMKLPHRYNTRLGERGAKLSGGERQRISIARAFVRNAPILILDEPTASVDSRTEAVILEALDRLMAGRTTLMIAHRLSTIRDAARILVVNDGELVEQGTHDELSKVDGLYRVLWEIQSGESRALLPLASASPSEGVPKTLAGLGEPLGGAPVPPIDLPSSRSAAEGRSRHRAPVIVVLGMMTKMPVAGVVWQTLHYLVGLERLGYEVFYVEAHARTPSMFIEHPQDNGSRRAAHFIRDVLKRVGLQNNWAFHALHDKGDCFGLTAEELTRLYSSAALIINLHGGTEPLDEHAATGRLIYVETDPVQLQIELAQGHKSTVQFLEPHSAFFTYGENYGASDCGLPVSNQFEFWPTRQPVVLDMWSYHDHPPGESFTTIGNWEQKWREVVYEGETYHWSKHHEFLKVVNLPRWSISACELALSSCPDEASSMLRDHGWRVRDGLSVSTDVDRYRQYVQRSRGEFTVAKDQNVRFRSGWFSDRSATYLASGRPVVTQDTGFGNILPVGMGLLAFSCFEEAIAAVNIVSADYARHSAAATEIARAYFDSDGVLSRLLGRAGMSIVGSPRHQTSLAPAEAIRQAHVSDEQPASAMLERPALPPSLDISVMSKRPLELSMATIEAVRTRGVPSLGRDAPDITDPLRLVSIVVVTFNNLTCTRLCIESVLANTGHTNYELVVVDNASADDVRSYLSAVARENAHVRVVQNGSNVGFPSAVNQGVAVSRGELLVLMNNDVIVGPGWLSGLLKHLHDAQIGVVGPTTNQSGNEAQIDTDYVSYADFESFVRRQAEEKAGVAFPIPVATLFCVALRRRTWNLVGPLDEGYGLGLFEDDDLAMRVRDANLEVLCAEDVFVHHFGEGAFGELVASGEHSELFARNRMRFEERWNTSWTPHSRRSDPLYAQLVESFRGLVEEHVPSGATIVVVSRGDDDLLRLGDRPARHFAAAQDGTYAGHHPGNGAAAVAMLQEHLRNGARFLAVPATASWWLERYTELAQLLSGDDVRVVVDNRVATIFDLEPASAAEWFTIGDTSVLGVDDQAETRGDR
jgi:ABC-type transport system involved in Fe-S cluster assembly fused permease/ATPase subunit/GT2 family glycosyltransferase